MAGDDFVMTIESDIEDDAGQSKTKDVVEDTQLDPEFTFDLATDPYAEFLNDTTELDDLVKEGSKPVCRIVFYLRMPFIIIFRRSDPSL